MTTKEFVTNTLELPFNPEHLGANGVERAIYLAYKYGMESALSTIENEEYGVQMVRSVVEDDLAKEIIEEMDMGE